MAPAKNSALMGELYAFIKSAEEVPYEDLGKYAMAEGWIWRLRQTGVQSTAWGTFAVSFVLMIGKASEPAAMEFFDEVTIQVPAQNMTAPSLFARLGADPTILHSVFGRIHPSILQRAAQAAAERPNAAPNGAIHETEQQVDMSKGDVEIDRAAPALPEVVKGRLRNGAPLFEDLFSLEGRKEDIVDAVLNAFVDYLPTATSPEDVVSVYKNNPVVREFFNDLATEEDRAELKKLLEDRTNELRPADTAPRRRRSAPAVN